MSRERAGLAFCLLSASAFSSAGLFGRLALDDGVGVMTLLALRYGGATALFWPLVRLSGQRLPGWRTAASVLGLGAGLFALQAGLFYAALDRLDAGLCTLLLYTFPAVVAVGSVVVGRERPSVRKAVAVLVATIGIGLVLLGDASLRSDVIGVVLALGSAVCAAAWVLASDRVLRGAPALVVSALVSTGAALSYWLAGLAIGSIALDFGMVGWAATLGTILISTVLAISTSLAGMARVGPTICSVLLTVEVPLAVTWAALLLGERLEPLQLSGGALVVAALVLLQAGTIRWPAWVQVSSAPLLRAVPLLRAGSLTRRPPVP
jgi:drug/metabolite transporter (DMT)-like permease